MLFGAVAILSGIMAAGCLIADHVFPRIPFLSDWAEKCGK